MVRFAWLLLFVPSLLFARALPPALTCAKDSRCCGPIEVFGEYLYMRPSGDSLAFYIADPRPYQEVTLDAPPTTTEQAGPVGTQCGVRPGYHSGFRVGAIYVYPSLCFDLVGRYTRIHTSDRKYVTPSPSTGGLWAVFLNNSNPTQEVDPLYTQNILFNSSNNPEFPGEIDAFALGTASFDLDSGDLTLGVRSSLCSCLWTRGFVGVHYAYLLHEFAVHYEGTLSPEAQGVFVFLSQALMADNKLTHRTWRVGPQFGVDLSYEIGCGFGIGGRFALGLLGGSRKSHYFEHFQTVTTLVDLPIETADRISDMRICSETAISRFLNARLGISYMFCCPCAFSVLMEFGYEFSSYGNMFLSRPIFRMDRGNNGAYGVNYTLDGFYVHVTLGF